MSPWNTPAGSVAHPYPDGGPSFKRMLAILNNHKAIAEVRAAMEAEHATMEDWLKPRPLTWDEMHTPIGAVGCTVDTVVATKVRRA